MGSEWGLSTNLPMQTEPWSSSNLSNLGTRCRVVVLSHAPWFTSSNTVLFTLLTIPKSVKFTAMFMQGAAPVPRSVGEHKYYFTFGFFWMGVIYIYIYSFYGIFLNQRSHNRGGTTLWDLDFNWLVGWLPFFACSHQYWEFLIIPVDEVIFFRGVAKNHQPDIFL